MRKFIRNIIAAALFLAPAVAMAASTVNPTVPATNAPMASAPIRSNFQATYNDINNILGKFNATSAPFSPSTYQEWVDTTTATAPNFKVYVGGNWVSLGSFNCTGSPCTWSPNNFPSSVPVSVNLNAASLQAAQTGTLFQGQAANGTIARAELDSFGAIASFTGVVAGGTKTSPTAVTSGTQLTGINAYAYNGASFAGPIASWRTYAAEDIASGHQGSKACMATTPLASTTLTDSLCQQPSGGVTIGAPTGGDKGVGTINVAGILYQNGAAVTTASTPSLNYLTGCTLSTAGSSTTFAIAPCTASDSTNTASMMVATTYTKTTGAWALGTAAGSLDVGTTGNSLWYTVYEIQRVDTGVVDYLTSLAPGSTSTVTITIASPGVVTWANNGLQANAPVKFTTTGALPTGLTAGTQYFVKTVVDVNTFTVSATQGGTAINTTGSQSGVQTATSYPVMPTNYTLFRRLGSMRTSGSANWNLFFQNGGIVTFGTETIDNLNTACVAVNTSYGLTVPPGVVVAPNFSLRVDYSGAVTNFSLGSGGSGAPWTVVPAASGGEAIVPITSSIVTNTANRIDINAASTNCQFTTFAIGYYDFRGQ